MIRKLLVANRGEIAIRAFRAANELGITSVAVFAYEDRYSLHRQKADESYEIGSWASRYAPTFRSTNSSRVAAIAECDAVYPGYGFLSETPDLASRLRDERASRSSGRRPACSSSRATRSTHSTRRRRRACPRCAPATLSPIARQRESGRDWPTRSASPSSSRRRPGEEGAGFDCVDTPDDLGEALRAASSEAASAFGDATVFLEQAVVRAAPYRGTGARRRRGRRGAPLRARLLDPTPSPEGHRDGAGPQPRRSLARTRSAPTPSPSRGPSSIATPGTVEFLVDGDGRHVFIEMNPRIQVEHTVTEEVTAIDIVQAQFRVASRRDVARPRTQQTSIAVSGAALQCRITTEDPANDFRPDVGRITALPLPGRRRGAPRRRHLARRRGAAVLRLTARQADCRGRTCDEARRAGRRALAEFRIRGVATNIAFLQAILDEPALASGRATTAFLDDHPDLARAAERARSRYAHAHVPG